jgi:hypothetical protein
MAQVPVLAAATLPIAESDVTGLTTDLAAKASAATLTSHTGNTSNPHSTTAAQAGAYTTAQVDTLIAAAQAASQPLDSDLTAIAALSTTSFGRALLALADASALRTAAGLGTAATQNTGAFDAAGAAAAAQAASQPLDSDLTAIAALSTTSFGRSVLALADAAALRTLAGLGTAATQATTAFDASGAASSAVATHAGLTATHGATGALVGTTNTQSLTNKTIADGGGNNVSAAQIKGLDVDTTGLTDGYVIKYQSSGSKWIVSAEAGGGGSEGLADVLVVSNDADGNSIDNLLNLNLTGSVGLVAGSAIAFNGVGDVNWYAGKDLSQITTTIVTSNRYEITLPPAAGSPNQGFVIGIAGGASLLEICNDGRVGFTGAYTGDITTGGDTIHVSGGIITGIN